METLNKSMIPRFYCPFPLHPSLHPGGMVELPVEAAHHALKVLRVGVGETAILFDGRGGQWTARLEPAGKRLHAILEAFDDVNRESPRAVTLLQCLPAADKMDFVVQKTVELGVAAIQPLAAKRSVLKLSGERMERRVAHWNSVAISACEQSGRNKLPPVAQIFDLPQYLGAKNAQNGLRLIALPQGGKSLREMAPPAADNNVVSILIGPEGGFEDGELKAASVAGFLPVSLGPRVLRTETAGPAALAALMSLWGDF